MTFPIDGTIPAAGHNPSADQPLMQANFANIESFLDVDHQDAGTVGAGNHKQIRFSINQAAPALTNAVSELFANLSAGKSELFFHNATQTFQLTDLAITTAANTGTAGGTISYFDTPWNMRFWFGQTAVIPIGGTRTVLFLVNFSFWPFTVATLSGGSVGSVAISKVSSTPGQLSISTSVNSIVDWFTITKL